MMLCSKILEANGSFLPRQCFNVACQNLNDVHEQSRSELYLAGI